MSLQKRRCRCRTMAYMVSGLLSACTTVQFPTEGFRSNLTSFVVDSSSRHVDQVILTQAETHLTEGNLVAWGRYVINRASRNVELSGSREITTIEANFARDAHIHLVPIVTPDQRDLKLNESEGFALGHEVAEALSRTKQGFAAAAEKQELLVFLDVEGDANPVTPEYLIGWCRGLSDYPATSLHLLPGIYTNASAALVRRAIIDSSQTCRVAGLWFANYVTPGATPPPAWKNFNVDTKRKLPEIPETIPIYLWQYSSGRVLDFSAVNPALSEEFLSKTLVF